MVSSAYSTFFRAGEGLFGARIIERQDGESGGDFFGIFLLKCRWFSVLDFST